MPFKEVSEDIARKEGEGDLFLDYWWKVHERFFINELKDTPFVFAEDMLAVVEEFKTVNFANDKNKLI